MRLYLFSPIPYSFLHQRPQNIAGELLKRSIDVTFVEPYGVTEFFAGRKKLRLSDPFTSLWYHLLGLWGLLAGRATSVPTRRGSEPKPFEILTLPFVIPSNRINSSFLDRLNASVCKAWLRRKVLWREGCRKGDVALVQQPYFGHVLQPGDFTRMYYDCIDESDVFSGRGSRERFREGEEKLLRMADGAFVTAGKLAEEIIRRAIEVPLYRIPNGVNIALVQEQVASGRQPEEMQHIKRPVAGYVGILRSWFDYEFIEKVARGLPELSIVLIGPYEETPMMQRVKGLANVHFLGRKPYRDVPSYIQGFDVGLIPFTKGTIAETTNPVKVFEYFALGKPVVSTWLRELVPFQELGLVTITDHDGSVRAVQEALAEADEQKADRRRAVARAHSWEHLVKRMTDVITGESVT